MDESKAMELAATQKSLITHDQALRSGLSSDQIQYLLGKRVLAAAHMAVYRFAGAAESRTQRLLAACLAVGPISAASHRSAAAMHGIWSTSEAWTEITVGRDRSPELA